MSNENRGTEITKQEQQPISMQMVTPDQMLERYEAISSIINRVMREGVHYGKPFEGSDKKVLLKAGGEALKVAFQLADQCEVRVIQHDRGHREYRVTTHLTHYPSGTYLGHGEGSCSTLESKYRYRTVDEALDVPVSPEFWDKKNSDAYGSREEQFLDMQAQIEDDLRANGHEYDESARYWITKTDNGQWVYSMKAKAENPDIADTYNTVLKIAKKRSELDAVINVTGCSTEFTQDVEEWDGYEARQTGGMTYNQKQEIYRLLEAVPGDTKQQLLPALERKISETKAQKLLEQLRAYKKLADEVKLYEDTAGGTVQEDQINQALLEPDFRKLTVSDFETMVKYVRKHYTEAEANEK